MQYIFHSSTSQAQHSYHRGGQLKQNVGRELEDVLHTGEMCTFRTEECEGIYKTNESNIFLQH